MTKTTKTIRPPIVTIMGHVDHGKTTLLDKIRSSHIADREAGAITQHIGAYSVPVKNKTITFIDTPGHAAFKKMRERGALVTDLVILVISAGEGIMPQTRECLEIIKSSSLPFIVAMTKTDLANISLDKVKGQLVEAGYTPEDYGGQLSCIPLSAKTGEGIDKLLDTILLNAEVLELESKPYDPLEAIVIESSMDKSRGPVATVVVRQGTLTRGSLIYADQSEGKIKALVDDLGKLQESVLPGFPTQILGFTTVPSVGSTVTSIKSDISSTPNTPKATPHVSSADKISVPVVFKADTQGTLEALKNSFTEEVYIVGSGVGLVNDNDVNLASSSGATIYSFNQKTPGFIQKLAENNKVKIVESRIIYEIIEMISQQVLKLMEPTIDETILGEGTIIAEFKIEKVRIAGVKITKGEVKKGDSIHLTREGKIIKDTRLGSLRQAKLELDSIKASAECGMVFTPYVDFKVGDGIISYRK